MFPSNPLPSLPTYLFEPSLAGLVSLILTIVLPLAAALFMRAQWSPTAKAVTLLCASAVKTLLEAWLASVQDGYVLEWWPLLYTTLLNLVIAVASYFGWLKGTTPQKAALHGGVIKDHAVQ